MGSSPSALKAIFLASRPKTWIAGISPVAIGSALAYRDGVCSNYLVTCSLLFSLLIQIGTNFANDYFDFMNGADTPKRIGPKRAVASGWLRPQMMRNSALIFFAAAFFVSLPLVFTAGIWSLIFVLSSIAFGILYTGGPRPLGYMGLGELLVLIYFGPVAVCGTYFVQHHTITLQTLCDSLVPGLLSTTILVANNLRDEETDRSAGKNTLVVRFGKAFGRAEYTGLILLASIAAIPFGTLFPLFILLAAVPLVWTVYSYKNPIEIVPLLPRTALLLILFTLLFCFESVL